MPQIIIDWIIFYFIQVHPYIVFCFIVQVNFAWQNAADKIKEYKMLLFPEAFIVYKLLIT
jgi:hypothetical protein